MKNLEMKIKNQSESKGRFHNMTVLGVDSTLVSDSPEEILSEGTTEQTMGACESATSLDTDFDESVNCGVQSQGGNLVLMYGLPGGAEKPNFGWRSTQGGYQARFRATRNGRICGHDSGIIPGQVYSSLGSASHGESGRSYRVTMSSGGQDLSRYF
ncbi:hypothetical protein V1264_010441 [Littorina saxatilis]|uniref:Uncharacterized protein n=1 Tax=Littorina saxatilis TaxID=31220 RepID=A0AAN9G0R3_9CAEN